MSVRPETTLFSESVIKTRKEKPKDVHSKNHELLLRAGFIRQEASGIYTLLPLGLRVLENIERVVHRGMNELGISQVRLPALQPKSVWEQTDRWDKIDVLFRLASTSGSREYALAATAEEIATPLAADMIESYRDLPMSFYTMGPKFRDEKRAKSGVIRGREFTMKDAYSFHATREDFEEFYENTLQMYLEIFRICGIEAKVTEADGGDYTALPTHEFMAISDAGEDTIVYCNGCTFAQNTEISRHQAGDACPKCGQDLSIDKSIEIGHIFDLGTKFTDSFELTFTDKDGEQKPVLMGCYGIGISRLIGTAVELHHDEKGIIWPPEIAPYSCHLVGLNLDDEEVRQAAYSLYEYLGRKGVSVLFDNRVDAKPGAKFSDADLMGMPTRLVISRRTVQSNSIEITNRAEGTTTTIPLDEFFEQLEQDNE